MKLVSYNVQFGIGFDGRFDCERIANEIGDADVICLQEVTRGFARNGGVDLVAIFQSLFPAHYSAFGAGADIDAGSSIENGVAVNRRFQFGNMILSRYPLLTSRNILLPRTRTFDRLNLQRSALETLIASPIGPIRVYSAHLDHRDSEERISQIEFLKARMLHYGLEGGAISGASEFGIPDYPHADDYVLMGDFNLRPDSPDYVAMCGPSDTYYGRTLRANHPVDVLARLGKTGPDTISWRDPSGDEPSGLLDYCFTNAGLYSRVTDGAIMTEATGSDHYPLWVTID